MLIIAILKKEDIVVTRIAGKLGKNGSYIQGIQANGILCLRA